MGYVSSVSKFLGIYSDYISEIRSDARDFLATHPKSKGGSRQLYISWAKKVHKTTRSALPDMDKKLSQVLSSSVKDGSCSALLRLAWMSNCAYYAGIASDLERYMPKGSHVEKAENIIKISDNVTDSICLLNSHIKDIFSSGENIWYEEYKQRADQAHELSKKTLVLAGEMGLDHFANKKIKKFHKS